MPVSVWLPLHAPEAVQLTAFVEDQVNVLLAPAAMVAALAVKVTVAGAAVTVIVVVAWAETPAEFMHERL